ncbi:oxidoreductase [Photobacterium japonica]|uniref:acrylyl-CoA reductase (NADPH) n=1 Tax=Photobacterium japonica TaxID=2910235 RepID=UPI003D12421B
MFKALVLNQEDKKTLVSIEQLDDSQLPEGDVLIDVDYSSLNYKDGLAITGKGRIVRQFPMVPGIDLTGTVVESADARYTAGDKVVLTGWGVGEGHWGGMAERARLKADWLVPLPSNLDGKQTMMIGTAGITAMLCVQALVDAGLTPESGEILVTGASGGVGSVAVTLLSQLGYKVVAVTGRVEENGELLTSLGATRVIDRSEFAEPARPLDKQLWAGAIDTVGSNMLARVLSQVDYDGAVAICGLAGGFDLPTTVMPFILRNVKLLGIDSVMCPFEKRQKAWQRLGELLPASFFEQACREVALEDVAECAEAITNGQITGRVVIKLK